MSTATSSEIASSLISLTRSMHHEVRATAPGCSFLEIKTLLIANERKNPSMKDMAEDLGISSPAMTPIIDKLVESGQLARSEDKLDRRVIRISITSQGKRSMEKSRAMMRSVIDKLISTLSREEQASLDQILRKLLSHYNPTNRTIA